LHQISALLAPAGSVPVRFKASMADSGLVWQAGTKTAFSSICKVGT